LALVDPVQARAGGLRWGELCRAQSRDFQVEVLTVHQTKTGKVRRVPLTPALQREVKNRVGIATFLRWAFTFKG
jgi:integrase